MIDKLGNFISTIFSLSLMQYYYFNILCACIWKGEFDGSNMCKFVKQKFLEMVLCRANF